ncbi:hypothetical protein FRC01_006930 [Tulasnella sp. 417]|nr:hypothetical protein FRC01_006930 [Tulasnella sp. 417]
MPKAVSLSFLGTCCGGGPLPNRCCSSSLLDVAGALWMIDCADGTVKQLMQAGIRISRLRKIFITHMHGDHCLGVVPVMANLMSGAGGTERTDLRLEVYGLSGIRELIRTTLRLTKSQLNGRYAVHELLHPNETPYTCAQQELHGNELPGRDIYCGDDGFWRAFEKSDGFDIDAGPIQHRVNSLGYVFREPPQTSRLEISQIMDPINRNKEALAKIGFSPPFKLIDHILSIRRPYTLPDGYVIDPPSQIPGRKLVILGDTHDPWAMKDLAMDASILVHEATNAYIPPNLLRTGRAGGPSSEEGVRAKAISKGHSTPGMAGEFAKAINAQRLVLNHFSGRFAPAESSPPYAWSGGRNPRQQHGRGRSGDDDKARMLREIERQATAAWLESPDSSKWPTAVAAWDFLSLDIREHEARDNMNAEISDIREQRNG